MRKKKTRSKRWHCLCFHYLTDYLYCPVQALYNLINIQLIILAPKTWLLQSVTAVSSCYQPKALCGCAVSIQFSLPTEATAGEREKVCKRKKGLWKDFMWSLQVIMIVAKKQKHSRGMGRCFVIVMSYVL